MALPGDVVAAAAVEAATLLVAVLAVPSRLALFLAVLAGPAPSAGALAVVGVAARAVRAPAVLLAVLAPLGERALCWTESRQR